MFKPRIRVVLSTLALACAAASGFATAGDVEWSIELRAASLLPIGADGVLSPVAGVGSGNRTEIDVLDALSPELAVTAAIGRRFDLSLAVGLSEQDIELDVLQGGEVVLGSVDSLRVQLSGLFHVAEWKRSGLSIGPVVAVASHDSVDVEPRARAVEGVVAGEMESATMLGVEARLDTLVGSRGWYFSSNLRYLVGESQLDVFTDSDASGPSTSGRVLAASGDAELDPLVVSFGFGRQF
jgi:outer membrane protein W